MEQQGETHGIPLLESSSSFRTATTVQTLGNIIVSVVGTGILGLPYAFRIAGWLAGSSGVIVAGLGTYYCMLLLVKCREKLASQGRSMESKTYGDLGYICMGRTGRYLTEFLISISQCGGSVAYLVFIGQNLSSVFNGQVLTFSSYIFLVAAIEIVLSWIGSLAALAPFSIFADICNAVAMGIVLKEDIQKVVRGGISFEERTAITSNLRGLPFAGGMAVFCFEGFGVTLALEASMKDKATFPRVLAQAFVGITILYVLFGFSGYMAYGDDTRDIITLNLPHTWLSRVVQVALCVGLVFTFPMMLHPINEIVEGNLKKVNWFEMVQENTDENSRKRVKLATYISRAIVVLVLAMLATCVPGFAVFASLVGSTVCALISFVLPAIFHLILMGSSLSFWQKAFDSFILMCGLLFAVCGTYNTLVGV